MHSLKKKITIRTLIIVYAISVFFYDIIRYGANAESTIDRTNIVTVLVDKDIYNSISSQVQRYATNYIQRRIANSKALVFPIDRNAFKAPDIAKMLENIYFDGIDTKTSKLIGVVLIGDLPLPVVEHDSYIFPSIYPYVDFEDQQYIRDAGKQYFTYNDNTNGQAELRHGLINFDVDINKYQQYFNKLQSYANNPSSFISPKIRYDDFIGIKQYFQDQNLNYYANNFIFAEDIAYHRYNNLFFNILQSNHNQQIQQLGDDLKNGVTNTNDTGSLQNSLNSYGNQMQNMLNDGAEKAADAQTNNIPTLVLQQSISAFLKSYDELIGPAYKELMRENTQAGGRRYISSGANDVDSHIKMISMRDDILTADKSNLQPILQQFNTLLEQTINKKIEDEKYYMYIPIPTNYTKEEKQYVVTKCEVKKDEYEAFLFGQKVNTINNANDLSIYLGTYQNYKNLSGLTLTTGQIIQSIGASYNIFSQQTESNRAYNILNMQKELDYRDQTRIRVNRRERCSGIKIAGICLAGSVSRDEINSKNCYPYRNQNNDAKEDALDFAARKRGGYSPLNLEVDPNNPGMQKLKLPNGYPRYAHAVEDIYDLAGTQIVYTAQVNDSAKSIVNNQLSIIQLRNQAGTLLYPRCIDDADKATIINGVPFIAKNTIGYSDVDFFNTFNRTSRRNIGNNTITLENENGNCSLLKNDYRKETRSYKMIDSRLYHTSPTPAQLSGMNITTPDRPIDSMRYVSFQGVHGQNIQLNYPNLYSINVYSNTGGILTLKSVNQIEQAIRQYLIQTVNNYNQMLQTAINGKTGYLTSNASAFSYLGQSNPLATPNRNYNLLDPNILVNALGTSNIQTIAELLYYQNAPRGQQISQANIEKNIQQRQTTADINHKIRDTMQQYLTVQNKSPLITPGYNRTGYEVAYINTNGLDYIASDTIPSFIENLQTQQEIFANKNTIQFQNDSNELSAFEQEEKNECQYDPISPVALDKRPAALACRLKQTLKKPLTLSASFPRLTNITQDIIDPLRSFTGQAQSFSQQRGHIAKLETQNQQTINNVSANQANTLQQILQYTITQSNEPSRYADPTITQNKYIEIKSLKDYGNIRLRISATGDNCLYTTGTNFNNFCTTPLSRIVNPYNSKITIPIILDNSIKAGTSKAGNSTIIFELCMLNNSNQAIACVHKTQPITILPGAVDQISMTTPDRVIAGGQIPLAVRAQDRFGNTISKTLESFSITFNTGTISDGNTPLPSITFNDFSRADFIYQAPNNAVHNTPVNIIINNVTNNTNNLTAKRITIVQPRLQVRYNNTIVNSITYTLPDTKTGIVFTDTNNLQQINPNNMPQIRIALQDVQGNNLSSRVTVSSNNTVVKAGRIDTRQVRVNNQQINQRQFVHTQNFYVQSGVLLVHLNPTFFAGQDTIRITIPGREPITIPITVQPGAARKVNLQSNDTALTPNKTGTIQIQVTDRRDNPIIQNTRIQLGIIGPIQTAQNSIILTGAISTIPIQATSPGGKAYIYAYVQGVNLADQQTAYQDIIVQESLVPTSGLNVMYLNLLGNDRGNQWGYFSQINKSYTQNIISKSPKLLTITTQLINPSKLQKVGAVINQHAQVTTRNNTPIHLRIQQQIEIYSNQHKVIIGGTGDFRLQQLADLTALASTNVTQNTIFYVPSPIDSFITGNTIQNNNIIINGQTVINLNTLTTHPELEFSINPEKVGKYTTRSITYQGKKVGILGLWRQDTNIVTNVQNLQNKQYVIFADGSTNGLQGIAIPISSTQTMQGGYNSIQDSADESLRIGFRAGFKHITNFAGGDYVGQATQAFASAFLINIGDPLVQRASNNRPVVGTQHDAGLGKTIYAEPGKTILKTIPADINSDGLQDIVIVYTDGSIRVSKNYGGTDPYSDLQNLMFIADSIKDIFVADTDGNKYPDVIVRTNSNQMRVYTNNDGIFDVDGKLVCLSIPGPAGSLESAHQVFIRDMDQDGTVDIVTNDTNGDIQIFYGGSSNAGPNYLSTLPYTCDSTRSIRQQNQKHLVKSFGVRLDANKKIIDNSIIHRQGLQLPDLDSQQYNLDQRLKNLAGDGNDAAIDTYVNIYKNNNDADMLVNNIKNIMNNQGPVAGVQNLNIQSLIQAGYQDLLKFLPSPFTKFKSSYETLVNEQIAYIPIQYLNTGDKVQVYKQYNDLNGDILRAGDEVQVTVTILGKADTKITFADQIAGPRSIDKRTNGQIQSFSGTFPTGISIQRRPETDQYDYIIDNINISAGQSIQFTYMLTYRGGTPMQIDVKDVAVNTGTIADIYPDISIQPQDSCSKYIWTFFNSANVNDRNRSYTESFQDIRTQINNYQNTLQTNQNDNTNDIVNSIQNSQNNKNVNDIPGLSNITESRNTENIIQSALNNGVNVNANIDLGILDGALARVSNEIDKAINNLCQGFSLGGGSPCLQPPVPFNMSFLSPGTFNIFGCTLFKDKGLPAFFAPSTIITPVGPVPFVGFFGAPLKGPGDTFYGAPGGSYPSMIRIYVSPTLTAQLGVAICLGPMGVGEAIPKPFRDLGGNCIVIQVPMPSCSDDGAKAITPQGVQTAKLDQRRSDAANPGTCNNPVVTSSIQFATGGTQTAYSSPFQLVSQSNTSAYPSPALPVNSLGFGSVVIDQKPISFQEAQGEELTLNGIELKAGPSIKLKIEGGNVKGLAQCIVQKRLDKQVKYIMANLTQMTIGITLPDTQSLFAGFENLTSEKLDALLQQRQDKENTDSKNPTITTITGFDSFNQRAQNNLLQQQTLADISSDISNPFEILSNMFNSVNIININTRDVNVTVPMIYAEDVIKYSSYLQVRAQENEQILIDRADTVKALIGYCNTNANSSQSLESMVQEFQQNQTIRQQRQQLQEQIEQAKANQAPTAEIQKLEDEYNKLNQCYNLTQSVRLQEFLAFQNQSADLIRTVKQNLKILEMYQRFPLDLYEWLHVTDRYLNELSSMVNNFLGTINYRLNTNAKRFSQYVDAIITLIGVIKTRQVLIDFSVNRNKNCSTCTNDTYDYYSCSLGFLCPDLPILAIPPFKLPSIFMDLSKIDIGIDILLPVFKFTPTKIPLPNIPNLPRPPSLNNIFINFPQLTVPDLPLLPMPPQLPELPSIVPQVNIELPVLPPAPRIPSISPQIQGAIKASEFIGKVLCIVKGQGIGLVAEPGVKSKIEQMTQRTRNVPFFDFFDQTSKFQNQPLQGFDYQIDSFVQLQFNFDHVYQFINSITSNINKTVDGIIQPTINNIIQSGNDATNSQNIQNTIQDIENPAQLFNTIQNTETIDYQKSRQQLNQATKLLAQHIDTSRHSALQEIEQLAQYNTQITPLTPNIQDIQTQVQQSIRNKKREIEHLQDRIKDYDQFIDEIKNNTIQLITQGQDQQSFNTPLFATQDETITLLHNQENPNIAYLKQHQQIAQGYSKALQNNQAETLGMTIYEKQKAENYLAQTQQTIDTSVGQLQNKQAHLLAQNDSTRIVQSNTRCPSCSSTPNKSTTDLSQYVQGLFIPGTSGQMINVVNSQENINQIQKNYLHQDLNNDRQKDILMRDSSSVYIKYANQNTLHSNDQNRYYTAYYIARTMNTPTQLQTYSDARGYVRIRDISIKIYDTNREVKNFQVQGQNFDSISFGRTNSKKASDSFSGYIIELNHRFDTFYDKEQIRRFLGDNKIAKAYIIVVPDTMQDNINQQTIILPEFNRALSIQELQQRNVIQGINYYASNANTIQASLPNLSRHRKYAKIATIHSTNNNARTRNSPRSNQIVAGTQIIGDNRGPEGTLTLYRPATNTVVATGENLVGNIATNYSIQSKRQDNVAVAYSWIEQNNQNTKILSGDTIQTSLLFFTGETEINLIFGAIDYNNNITRIPVTLQIQSPTITITQANEVVDNTATITAQLSQDVDQALVQFQRQRNGMYQTLTGIANNIPITAFPVTTGQITITGGIFDIGKNIGLYDTANNRIASINPDNGNITIETNYISTIATRLDTTSHVPVIQLYNINNKQVLFNIFLQSQELKTNNPIQIVNSNYTIINLDNKFASFANGFCIQDKQSKTCIAYISSKGVTYIPSPYHTTLQGTYSFDPNNGYTQYTLQDNIANDIAKIHILAAPLK